MNETRDIINDLLNQLENKTLHEITPETLKAVCLRVQESEKKLVRLQKLGVSLFHHMNRTAGSTHRLTFLLMKELLKQHVISIGKSSGKKQSTSHEDVKGANPICDL